MPELFILMALAVGWLVPLAAAAWALYTLYKMRGALERIEQLLRAR